MIIFKFTTFKVIVGMFKSASAFLGFYQLKVKINGTYCKLQKRQAEDGKEFFVLEIEGNLKYDTLESVTLIYILLWVFNILGIS